MSRYGVRAPTEECSLAVVVISLQSIVGVVIQVITCPSLQSFSLPLHIAGLHGGNRVCQVHQADHAGRDHPLQQERLDHRQERLHVPRVQDRWPQVRERALTWHSSTVLCPACLSCIQQQYAKQHYWALSGLGGTPANNTIVQSKQSNMVQCGSSPPRCFINSLSFVVSSFIFRWDDKILWESVRHQPSFETREHSGGSNHQPFIALSLHSTYRKFSLLSPDNVLQLKEPFSQYFRDF